MQEKRRFGIVGSQRARKVDSAVLFHACRFGLADDFHVHVGGGGGIELCIAGHEGNLQNDGVRTGHDFDHLARHFGKLQAAGCQPSQFALVTPGLQVRDHRRNGHVLLGSREVRRTW